MAPGNLHQFSVAAPWLRPWPRRAPRHPTRRSSEAASVRLLPVVTRSSTTTTGWPAGRPATEPEPARQVRAAGAGVESGLVAQATVLGQRPIRTVTGRLRASRRAARRASAAVASNPRSRTAAAADGTGTRIRLVDRYPAGRQQRPHAHRQTVAERRGQPERLPPCGRRSGRAGRVVRRGRHRQREPRRAGVGRRRVRLRRARCSSTGRTDAPPRKPQPGQRGAEQQVAGGGHHPRDRPPSLPHGRSRAVTYPASSRSHAGRQPMYSANILAAWETAGGGRDRVSRGTRWR